MASVLRSALVFAFASCLVVLSAPGCSDQGEGERCSRTKAQGNGECDSGLICVPKGELLENITDLCCPPEGQESSARCTRVGKISNTAGSSNGGTAGTGGTSPGGAAGESSGGAPDAPGGAGGAAAGGAAAGETGVGGLPAVDGGAPNLAGASSVAGAPLSIAGQGGSD